MFEIFGTLWNLLPYLWWILLAYIAYWLYTWVEQKLAFSSLLTIVVAAILIYFLVIVYPLVGVSAVLFWIIFISGALYMLPIIAGLFMPRMKK